MVRAVIGADPGRKSGGIAVIEEGYSAFRVCKNFCKDDDEGDILGGESLALMREYRGRAVAVVEKLPPFRFMPRRFNPKTGKMDEPQRLPMDGRVVRHHGALLGACQALEIPIIQLMPRWWQATLGCMTKGDKDVTKRMAEKLFDLKVAFNITHWNADCLLMAEAGWRLMTGQARINGMPDPRRLWPC